MNQPNPTPGPAMERAELVKAVHRLVYPRHNIDQESYCEGDHERSGSCQWLALPDYANDLNAIDRAVREWANTPERKARYVRFLYAQLMVFFDNPASFELLNATAEQRCAALLAAAGKGEANA